MTAASRAGDRNDLGEHRSELASTTPRDGVQWRTLARHPVEAVAVSVTVGNARAVANPHACALHEDGSASCCIRNADERRSSCGDWHDRQPVWSGDAVDGATVTSPSQFAHPGLIDQRPTSCCTHAAGGGGAGARGGFPVDAGRLGLRSLMARMAVQSGFGGLAARSAYMTLRVG